MKKTQSVRLNDLRHSKNPAELIRGRRNLDCEQRIAGFGGSNQMADRADPADAGHQRRHFSKRAPFAELLETAELGDMEASIFHVPVLIEVQRDFRVALDAGHWIDQNCSALCHLLFLRLRALCEIFALFAVKSF